GAERAAAVFTDPPYNVAIDGHVSGLGKIHHREFVMATGEMTPEEFTVFLTAALLRMKGSSQPGSPAFVCIDWRHLHELLAAARSTSLEMLNLCVWTKPNAGMGSLYRSQHELVFVFKLGAGDRRGLRLCRRSSGDNQLERGGGPVSKEGEELPANKVAEGEELPADKATEDDERVGYGRPPIRTRFRPGQSGNPRGRPRGARNLATEIAAALAEKVAVTENGRRRHITKLRA